MKPNPSKPTESDPVLEPAGDTFYSLEVIAELAGLTPKTVLHYHAMGVISPATSALEFDTENLRHLRRLEHLRHLHHLNDSSLQFISNLLHEVDALRQELRQRALPQW